MLPAATACSALPSDAILLEMERQRWEVETMVVQIQIVIIYSPQDIAARDALSAALRKAGADVWYDAVPGVKGQALVSYN